jgi:hypothetical protein
MSRRLKTKVPPRGGTCPDFTFGRAQVNRGDKGKVRRIAEAAFSTRFIVGATRFK